MADDETSKVSSQTAPVTTATTSEKKVKTKRRIIRRKHQKQQQQPQEPSPELLLAISKSSLPSNYNFEIFKTLQRINSSNASHVALQFPEGLLMYSCILSDLLKKCSLPRAIQISILGDVTYGACCVDDLGAKALDCDLLVHYGHSCLVPVSHTALPCLYVFVEINVDISHLVQCVCATVPEGKRIFVMGTIQFRNAVLEASQELTKRNRQCNIPQCKPLSPGEVLGCTAPHIPLNCDEKETGDENKPVIVFISDGRFHLEAAMISNPKIPTLRYDPYGKVLSREYYDFPKMLSLRYQAIQKAKKAHNWGIILGTLGRQGNPSILLHVKRMLKGKNQFVLLLSEIYPAKLELFHDVEAWVQVACPRLSIDWGHYFSVPILNSYELQQCVTSNMEEKDDREEEKNSFFQEYPMDYYSKEVSGPWGNYHETNVKRSSNS